jgi:hypothetical protein
VVHSVVGVGTTFTLWLPIVGDPTGALPTASAGAKAIA